MLTFGPGIFLGFVGRPRVIIIIIINFFGGGGGVDFCPHSIIPIT